MYGCNVPCIYAVENIKTGEIYVGSTVRFAGRISQHFTDLKRRCHPIVKFQRSYDLWGKNNFIGYILEVCKLDDLGIKEMCWIVDIFRMGKNLFNVFDNHFHSREMGLRTSEGLKASYERRGGSPLKGVPRDPELMAQIHAKLAEGFASGRLVGGMKGKKQSEEHKRKIKEALTGKTHNVSEEGKAAMDASRRKMTPAKEAHLKRLANRVVSPETKEKLRQKTLERWARKKAANEKG